MPYCDERQKISISLLVVVTVGTGKVESGVETKRRAGMVVMPVLENRVPKKGNVGRAVDCAELGTVFPTVCTAGSAEAVESRGSECKARFTAGIMRSRGTRALHIVFIMVHSRGSSPRFPCVGHRRKRAR